MRIEAENFTIQSGFTLANNTTASGGTFIQSNSPSTTARANYTFTGADGVYRLTLGHYDENDGVASMSVLVNGVAVKGFLWDKQLGSANAGTATRTTEVFGNVALKAGDVVSLVGRSTTGEPLRTDYLDIDLISAPDPTESAPVNTRPATASTSIGASFAFSGANLVSVADADADTLTTVVSVTSGGLAVASGSGADVISYAPTSVTLSGSAAQVNAALAGLVFTPAATGPATLTVQTSDGSLTDTDQVAITVNGFGNANADISVRSLDPAFLDDRLHFSHIDAPNTQGASFLNFKTSATVRLTSSGTEALTFTGHELTGPFKLANPNQLNGLTLQPGQFVDVVVQFDRTAFTERLNNVSSIFTGELKVSTNDLEDNVITVDLAGNWQRVDEGSWEPNINEIWEVFGFGNRIAGLPFVDSLPSPLNQGGVYQAFDQYEVLSPYWQLAPGVTEARVTHIAQYAGRGTAELGIHRPFQKGTEAVQLTAATGGSQQLLPTVTTTSNTFVGTDGTITRPFSSATFTNVTIPDAWQGSDVFGIHLANFSTDPTLNTVGDIPPNLPQGAVLGQWMRIFQAIDENGNIIPNVYLGVQDFSGSNGDYNDNLLVIEGVAPASHAPVNTGPGTVAATSAQGFAFSGVNRITVTDQDGLEMTPSMSTRLNVANGVLTIGAASGATVAGNGTGAVTLSGTLAQVNAALGTLGYTSNAFFDGQDTLTIASLDRVLTGTKQIAINVAPIDNAPFVQSASIANVTASGGTTNTLTVVYADVGLATGIDVSSIGADDVIVRGPNGQILNVTGFTVNPAGNGTPVTATYTVEALGGTWNLNDNGAYTIELKANEVRDVSGKFAPTTPTLAGFNVSITPPPPVRVEAENFTLIQGFSLAGSASASGGSVIRANGAGEQRATHTFTGANGIYDLRLFYYDENDGVAQLSILVNGQQVDSFLWDQNLGTANINATSRTSHLTTSVTLKTGDVVTLSGFQNAGESLRIDALDFQYVGDPVPSANPPVNTAPASVSLNAGASFAFAGANLVSVNDADGDALSVTLSVAHGALTVGAGGATVTGAGTGAVTVSGTIAQINATVAGLTYTPQGGFAGSDSLGIVTSDGLRSDSDAVAITVNAVDTPPTVVSATIANVTSAGGTTAALTVVCPGGAPLTVTGVSVDTGSNGTPRTATYTIAAPGGTWNLADNGAYTIALDSDEVRDTAGQAVAGTPALAGFNVSITPPAPFRIEAESMTLTSFAVNTLNGASGGSVIKAIGAGEQRAAYAFAGQTGVYDLRLFYYDENDGAAPLSILVNGIAADSFVWNQNLGSANAVAATRTSHLTSGVALQTGDVVTLSGFANAGEPLRIDALDFTYISDLTAPVNTAPASVALQTDTSFAFTGVNLVSVNDADGGTLSVSLSVAHGALNVGAGGANVTGAGTGAVTVSGTIAQINATVAGLTYTPQGGFAGTDSLGIVTSDGLLSDSDAVAITVSPPNSAPVNTAPASVALNAGASFAFTGADLVSVNDIDGGALSVSLSVAHGVLTVGAGEATVTGAGTGAVTVSGTIAQINATVAGLTYTPQSGFAGTDSLGIVTSDGLLSDSDAVAITVTQVDAAPQVVSATIANVTTPGGASRALTVVFSDDAGVDISSIDAGDITVTGPGGAPLTVTGVSVDTSTNGTPRTATYTIAAPGGAWDIADNGAYAIALKAGEVRDTAGQAVAEAPALAGFNVSITPPPAPFRIEAENMARVSFAVNTLSGASGGSVIKAIGTGEQRATHTFTGPDGVYDLRLFYYDENDGAAQLSVLVNGIAEDSFIWDQNLGNANANNATRTSHLTAGVELETGDEIVLSGFANAGEPLRIDALDFTFVDYIFV